MVPWIRFGFLARSIAIAGCCRLFSPGLAVAQTSIDLRQAAPELVREITSSCSVFGEGRDGRNDGLDGVTSAVRTHNGSLFVVNGGTGELLQFAREGRYTNAVAREGRGPGELTRLNRGDITGLIVRPYRADSIAIFDRPQWRVTVYDASGRIGRVMRVPSPRMAAFLPPTAVFVGATATQGDFVFVTRPLGGVRTMPPGGIPASSIRDSIVIVRLSASGDSVWVSPPLEDAMRFIGPTGPPTVGTDGRQMVAGPPPSPMERVGSVAVLGDQVYHYVERLNELHVFDRRGQRSMRVLLPATAAIPVNIKSSGARRSLTIVSDGQSNLWLEVPPRLADSREWWRIVNGASIHSALRTPLRQQLLVGDSSSVVLRAIDSDGVQTIRSCQLRAPSRY